jgi:hypothetical protein
MTSSRVDSCVRLKQAIPELSLPAGAVGTVCSAWFAPDTAYEVEFRATGLSSALRVLLLEKQLESVPALNAA